MLKFLEFKRSRIRGDWESKQDAGLRSITKARFGLIKGKLLNYLVPFLGEKTDVRSVPFAKWNHWQQWRMENHARGHERPKAITIQNEMGMIRECWKWGMENSLIVFSPKLPFHDENLITDDKVRRETWEPHEWSSFARRARGWLKEQQGKSPAAHWDAFVAYQMLFFLANNGMRTGEVVKLRRKDIQFYEREDGPKHKRLCALVQVHPSTKTGAREVNSMGVNSPSGFGIAQSTSPRTTSFSASWTEVSSPLGNSERSSSRSSRSWERRNGLANAWSLIRSDTFMHQPAFRTERLSRRSAKTWA